MADDRAVWVTNEWICELLDARDERDALWIENERLRAALSAWQQAYDEARENAGPYIYALESAFEETARDAYAVLDKTARVAHAKVDE